MFIIHAKDTQLYYSAGRPELMKWVFATRYQNQQAAQNMANRLQRRQSSGTYEFEIVSEQEQTELFK